MYRDDTSVLAGNRLRAYSWFVVHRCKIYSQTVCHISCDRLIDDFSTAEHTHFGDASWNMECYPFSGFPVLIQQF